VNTVAAPKPPANIISSTVVQSIFFTGLTEGRMNVANSAVPIKNIPARVASSLWKYSIKL
jgi:hypothetical protein